MRQASRRKTTKTTNRGSRWHTSFWRKPSQAVPLLLVIVAVAVVGYLLTFGSHAAPNCTPTANYVNPCRPWFGAAVGGYPGVSNAQGAQVAHQESLIGHKMDIRRDYVLAPSSDTNAGQDDSIPMAGRTGSNEKYFASKGYALNINWAPAQKFQDAEPTANGGTANVNSRINQAAANFANFQKQYPNTKVFLTPWHEINIHTTTGAASCNPKASWAPSYGTSAQFVAAWRNIYNIFKAHGVHDVLWTLGYSGQGAFNCVVPYDWPGSQYVDWINYDTYDHNQSPNNPNAKNTWATTIGGFYNVLQSVPGSIGQQIASKPWGVGEFGTGKNTDQQNVLNYWNDGATAVKDNTYPKLKMYLIFADYVSHTNEGALTDYDSYGHQDPDKQKAVNNLVDAIYSSPPGGGGGHHHKDTKPPSKPKNLHVVLATPDSATIAWGPSTDNVGVAGYHVRQNDILVGRLNSHTTTYTANYLKPGTRYSFRVHAYDAVGHYSDGPTVTVTTPLIVSPPKKHKPQPPIIIVPPRGQSTPISSGEIPQLGGTVTLSTSTASATTIKVDGTTVSKNGTLNTTYLTNGKHTVTLTGSSGTSTQIIDVANHLNPWQQIRNQAFGSLRGSPTAMNSSMWTSTVAVIVIVGFVVYRFRKTRISYASASSRR